MKVKWYARHLSVTMHSAKKEKRKISDCHRNKNEGKKETGHIGRQKWKLVKGLKLEHRTYGIQSWIEFVTEIQSDYV